MPEFLSTSDLEKQLDALRDTNERLQVSRAHNQNCTVPHKPLSEYRGASNEVEKELREILAAGGFIEAGDLPQIPGDSNGRDEVTDPEETGAYQKGNDVHIRIKREPVMEIDIHGDFPKWEALRLIAHLLKEIGASDVEVHTPEGMNFNINSDFWRIYRGM